MDAYRNFTDEARRTLTYAQDEARRLEHSYIGTEHLLLGILRADGAGAAVLRSMGVDLPKVRTAVEFIIGRGGRPSRGEVGLTERAKRVIEIAIEEARRLDHGPAGSEHLLLACIREGEGIASGVLQSLGVTLDGARGAVVHLRHAGPPAAPADEAHPSIRSLLVTALKGDIAAARELADLYVDVAASPLQHVVAIGQQVEDAGNTAELIALEIREAGCFLYWVAHAGTSGLGLPEFTVEDDACTAYRVGALGSSASGHDWRGHAVIAPRPPDAAHVMRVEIQGFGTRRRPSHAAGEVRGSWRFEFRLDV